MWRTLDRSSRIVLLALLLFALLYRLSTLMMIHTGVDERDYWTSAKAIAQGLPYPELSHRTTRFSLILPVAAAVAALGSHPNVYYALPLLNCLVQVALAFLIGFRLRGLRAGFIAGLCLVLFPYMIRAGSQVRPEIFSMTYILAATYCLVSYFERDDGALSSLLWATAWIFIAYEAKITNLFFVPGIFLAILLFKKKPGHAFLHCGLLLMLFLFETGVYALFTQYKLGQLQIILTTHVSGDYSFFVGSFLGLFMRYSSRYLQAYWQIPFLVFLMLSVYYLCKRRDKRLSAIIIASLSFFVGVTFAVRSLHPISPAESFINRYFSAVLGPLFVTIGYAFDALLDRYLKRGARPCRSSGYLLLLGLGAAATLGIFSYPRLPSGMRTFVNSPLHPDLHPLALNERYRREINEAYDKGTPIIADAGDGGADAILTCVSYYLDLPYYLGGRPPTANRMTVAGKEFLVLTRRAPDSIPPDYEAAIRFPFRLLPLKSAQLPLLTDTSVTGSSRSSISASDE